MITCESWEYKVGTKERLSLISSKYLIFPNHTSHWIILGSGLNIFLDTFHTLRMWLFVIDWAQDMVVVASSKEHAAVTYAPADQEPLGFWHLPEAWKALEYSKDT